MRLRDAVKVLEQVDCPSYGVPGEKTRQVRKEYRLRDLGVDGWGIITYGRIEAFEIILGRTLSRLSWLMSSLE